MIVPAGVSVSKDKPRPSTILGTSERTALKHLGNATLELECTNKHQAVVKALRLGLIG
ncbi:MAG: helix-turn-helix transcriptional regulator [Burkholderiaceae bacterium]|jgi:DNA-binding CsgD family transcriptional regulator|nr:helix-turn-helix transcriptional regulator [Burkholderiaceae bacterium]